MRPSTYLPAALIVVLAGVSMLAWQNWQELAAMRLASEAAARENSALQARLAEQRKRNLELQAQLVAAHVENIDAAAVAADVKDKAVAEAVALNAITSQLRDTTTADGPSKKDEQLELVAALANTPEFQKLLAQQEAGQVDARYSALFKKLKLTPDEATKLETLLAEKQNTSVDVMLAVHDQGLTGKDATAAANQLTKTENQQINDSIKDLLGPQRYAQYQNYEQTTPQRQTVDQLAQRLSYTATPLTPSQSDRLVQILASNATVKTVDPATGQTVTIRPSTAPLPPSLSGLGVASDNFAPITNTAVSKAQNVLSPPQVAALQQMQQAQQAQQTINNLVRSATKPAPIITPTAPVAVAPHK